VNSKAKTVVSGTKADYDRLSEALDDCLALTYGLRRALLSKQKVAKTNR